MHGRFPAHALPLFILAASSPVDAGQPPCDPYQIATISADDAGVGDIFGYAVSIDSNLAIIGAYQDDDAGSSSGSAYIFRNVGGVWQQVAKLTASDGAPGDAFGYSVAISNGIAVVGAHSGDDSEVFDSGAAYVFREIDGEWEQVAKLTAADAAYVDRFGVSIAIDGNTVVVGATHDDDGGPASGSAYVFGLVDSEWQQIAKLTASDGDSTDHFGISVSISGTTIVVGADSDENGGALRGSAYVFQQIAGTWQQVAILIAFDAASGNLFGHSVSLDGDTALVGAYGTTAGTTLGGAGSAYIFQEINGLWQFVAKLTASDGAYSDWFGHSVSLRGGIAVVGAPQDDDAGSNSGSIYVFRDVNGVWQQVDKLIGNGTAPADAFGYSVSLSGNTVIAGAHGNDAFGVTSGAAHLFRLRCIDPLHPIGDLNCDGLVNLSDLNPFTLALTNLPGYATEFPECDLHNANVNGDDSVDGNDISAFVALLLAP